MIPGKDYTEAELLDRSAARSRLWGMTCDQLAAILTGGGYTVTDVERRHGKTSMIGRIMIHDLPVPGGE